ncbi:MAG: hypothetical protein HN348_36130 [Proteobacteria bacterium]|nr:hypothetical protein [Pseudomonadota bacterium]
MQILVLALFLALTPPAHALAEPKSGPYVDLGVGLGAGDAPFAAGLGWQAGFGWWVGPYDRSYAFGRFWSIGATLRQDWIKNSLHTAPLLEVRRGMDLFVAGGHIFFAGGPTVVGKSVGPTARVGIGAKFRRHRFWGLTLRLEGGASYVDKVPSGQMGVLLGGSFARPIQSTK